MSLAVYENSLAELGPRNIAHNAHDARTLYLQNRSLTPTTVVSARFTKCCRRWRQSSLHNRLGAVVFVLPPAPVLPEAGCVSAVLGSPAAAAGSWLVAGAGAVAASFCRRRYTGIRASQAVPKRMAPQQAAGTGPDVQSIRRHMQLHNLTEPQYSVAEGVRRKAG